MNPYQRTVVISEPHVYSHLAKYGGHQYADVFARYGWNVILLSASFNWWRLCLRRPGVEISHMELWRAGGRAITPNLFNISFAHPMPTSVRFARPIRWLSRRLYVPSPAVLLRKMGIKHANLLWLNGNYDWLYRWAIPHDQMVVRIIDNYAGFEEGYSNFHPLMHETLEAADSVFACSQYVSEMYHAIRADITVIPNGVDWEHFVQSAWEVPEILRAVPNPRAVYVGAIAEWFDWELVCNLAKLLTKVQFLLIGNWLRQSPTSGAYPRNIHILGPVAYNALPAVLAHCDVGLVPFKNTNLVRGVSPIKIYEYLAAGLPVVALRWRELELESLPITLASNATEFAAGIENALKASESDRAALRKFAQDCTWEQRLRKLLKTVGIGLNA